MPANIASALVFIVNALAQLYLFVLLSATVAAVAGRRLS